MLCYLPVASVVIPAFSSPPCMEHEEKDTKDYDDDNYATYITHHSYVWLIHIYYWDVLNHCFTDGVESSSFHSPIIVGN